MSKHISRPLRSTAEKLKQARKAVKRTVVKAKNEWIFSKCSELNNASNTGTKVFWESVIQLGAGLCKTSDTFMDLPGYLENIEHSIKNNFTLKSNEIDDVLIKKHKIWPNF